MDCNLLGLRVETDTVIENLFNCGKQAMWFIAVSFFLLHSTGNDENLSVLQLETAIRVN